MGRTCGVCFSAFVPLVSCSSVFASAVFCCSLISFCDHGAYTHRSRVGSTSALHAYEPSISAAVALGVHVRCVI